MLLNIILMLYFNQFSPWSELWGCKLESNCFCFSTTAPVKWPCELFFPYHYSRELIKFHLLFQWFPYINFIFKVLKKPNAFSCWSRNFLFNLKLLNPLVQVWDGRVSLNFLVCFSILLLPILCHSWLFSNDRVGGRREKGQLHHLWGTLTI